MDVYTDVDVTRDGKPMVMEVVWDDITPDPREDTDANVACLYTWHPRYASIDTCEYDEPEDFIESVLRDAFATPSELVDAYCDIKGIARDKSRDVMSALTDDGYDDDAYAAVASRRVAPRMLYRRVALMPIYLLDHSGLAYSTSDFSDPWDSGMVGFGYIPEDVAKATWPGLDGRALLDAAHGRIADELATFDAWQSGDCFGAELYDADGDNVDSCYGYIGYRSNDEMIKAMAETLCVRLAEGEAA